MKQIRIVIADDHTVVREGLRSLLETLPGIRVIGEASDGHELLQLIGSLHPDVVLMDIGMPRLNGIEATARVTREFPGVRVVILSMHSTGDYVLQALRAGARGYVLKNANASELQLAVAAAANGQRHLSPEICSFVVDEFLKFSSERKGALQELTSRQREILQLIAEGNTSNEIAGRLAIGIKTVETHRSELMQRLDIHDVAGLTRYAIRTGVVTAG
jgi:DNA-binding NarL/FixJ family response regulator